MLYTTYKGEKDMSVYSKKPRIYAFRLNRRSGIFALLVITSVIAGYLGSRLLYSYKSDSYKGFLQKSFLFDIQSQNALLLKPTFRADKILRQTSPLFTEDEDNISVFNPKGADMPKEDEKEENEEENLPITNGNVIEKSIAGGSLEIANATDYEIDALSLVSSNIRYNASSKEPSVLIMHTHGCETYSDLNGKGLGDDGGYRSTKDGNNVVSIGETLSHELEKRGIKTIHDKTLCDYPSYNSAYKTGMGLNDWYLNRYPSIRFIFDIHRDAIIQSDQTPVKLTAEIGGEKCAQAMIVCGTDKLGLSHPYWKDNLTLGLKIQKIANEKYPGLMRPLNLREERFNMHQTKGSLIFEIGTCANTMDEAKRCAVYLADCVSQVLTD